MPMDKEENTWESKYLIPPKALATFSAPFSRRHTSPHRSYPQTLPLPQTDNLTCEWERRSTALPAYRQHAGWCSNRTSSCNRVYRHRKTWQRNGVCSCWECGIYIFIFSVLRFYYCHIFYLLFIYLSIFILWFWTKYLFLSWLPNNTALKQFVAVCLIPYKYYIQFSHTTATYNYHIYNINIH